MVQSPCVRVICYNMTFEIPAENFNEKVGDELNIGTYKNNQSIIRVMSGDTVSLSSLDLSDLVEIALFIHEHANVVKISNSFLIKQIKKRIKDYSPKKFADEFWRLFININDFENTDKDTPVHVAVRNAAEKWCIEHAYVEDFDLTKDKKEFLEGIMECYVDLEVC